MTYRRYGWYLGYCCQMSSYCQNCSIFNFGSMDYEQIYLDAVSSPEYDGTSTMSLASILRKLQQI